jgi:ATP-dependent protease ClpP protease subunit
MPVKKKTELEQLINDIHFHHLNYHTRDIYIHSSGFEDGDGERGVEFRMATTFVKNLHILLNQNAELPILVHMHSIGGEWNDGMAMFNSIRFASAPFTILAYAQASSMTGILLQAADERIITPDCEFMIHHGSIALENNSMAVKSAVDANERYCKRMLDIFAKRAKNGKFFKDRNYSESKIKTYIDRKIKDKSDWYLGAEEAVYYGLADGILGSPGYNSPDRLRVITKYKGKI